MLEKILGAVVEKALESSTTGTSVGASAALGAVTTGSTLKGLGLPSTAAAAAGAAAGAAGAVFEKRRKKR
jgi:hypothetical protein